MTEARTCSQCGAKSLAHHRTTIRTSGITKSYACTKCGHRTSVGTWGNVSGFLALALLIMPAVLYFHPAYTLQTVPPMFFIGIAAFLGFAGFEAYRIKQFNSNNPVAT